MRVALVAAVLCLSVLNFSAVSSAQAAVRQTTNIAPQGLGPALQALAKERNFQLVYRSEFVRDLRTQGAAGELTSDEALTQLLSGTGLAFRYLDERTVTVFPISSTGTPSEALVPVTAGSVQSPDESVSGNSAPKSRWNGFRLAQNDQSSQEANATSTSKDQGADQSRAIGTDEQVDLGEIVVTGTNIRGVYPSSSPVQIYTAEDIARTGATTTEQFIGKLPQNLATRTQYAPGSTAQTNREGVNTIDLRGLGVGTTLTLLNGRRLGLASNGQATDISLIPLSAVSRVEVLTDGASAIYGSDAIGGVVNFVLREDFDGAETRLSYGEVTSGGLRQFGGTQTFGGHWSTGHALVSYDYFDASPLETSDRVYAAPAGPGTLTPVDVRQGLLLTIGQDVTSRLALSADFVAGMRDVESDQRSVSGITSVTHADTEQYFANVVADYEVSSSLNASILVSHADTDVDNQLAQRTATTTSPIRDFDTDYSGLDITARLEGTLFAIPGGPLRFAVGGGRTDEQYLAVTTGRDLGRETVYAFGELYAPLVNDDQDVPLVHRLELSLAARYTDYEDTSNPALGRDFGSRTSGVPRIQWTRLRPLR